MRYFMVSTTVAIVILFAWNISLTRQVSQLEANLATQVAAYNHLAGIVGELEHRPGIPPANRGREQ